MVLEGLVGGVALGLPKMARLVYLYALERRGADPGHIERMGRVTQTRIARPRLRS